MRFRLYGLFTKKLKELKSWLIAKPDRRTSQFFTCSSIGKRCEWVEFKQNITLYFTELVTGKNEDVILLIDRIPVGKLGKRKILNEINKQLLWIRLGE